MGDGKVEESEAVGISYCGLGMGGWVGRHEEEEEGECSLVSWRREGLSEMVQLFGVGGWLGGWVGG